MNSDSKAMKRDMLKAAEKRFLWLPASKRRAAAQKVVDIFVAKTRSEVKRGVVYVEANHG